MVREYEDEQTSIQMPNLSCLGHNAEWDSMPQSEQGVGTSAICVGFPGGSVVENLPVSAGALEWH